MDVQQAVDNLHPDLKKNAAIGPSENQKNEDSVITKIRKQVCNLVTGEETLIFHGSPTKKICGINKSFQNGYSSEKFTKKHKPETLVLKKKQKRADDGNNEASYPYQNILQMPEKKILKAVPLNSSAENPLILNTLSTIFPLKTRKKDDSVIVNKEEITNLTTCKEALTTSVSSDKKFFEANMSFSPCEKSYFQIPKKKSCKKAQLLKNDLENYSKDTVLSVSMGSSKNVKEKSNEYNFLSENSTAENPLILNTHSTIYPLKTRKKDDSVMIKREEITNLTTCKEALTTSVSSDKVFEANKSFSVCEKSYFQTQKKKSCKKAQLLKNALEHYSMDTILNVRIGSSKNVKEKSNEYTTPSEKTVQLLFRNIFIDQA